MRVLSLLWLPCLAGWPAAEAEALQQRIDEVSAEKLAVEASLKETAGGLLCLAAWLTSWLAVIQCVPYFLVAGRAGQVSCFCRYVECCRPQASVMIKVFVYPMFTPYDVADCKAALESEVTEKAGRITELEGAQAATAAVGVSAAAEQLWRCPQRRMLPAAAAMGHLLRWLGLDDQSCATLVLLPYRACKPCAMCHARCKADSCIHNHDYAMALHETAQPCWLVASAHLCRCAGQLSAAETEKAELKASLEAATAQCQQLEERAAGLDTELAAAHGSLEGRGAELEAAGAELAAAQQRVAALTGGLLGC